MIIEGSFFALGKYGGVALDIYNGTYKIIGAWEGIDGVIRADWLFPQTKGPGEKAVPLSVDLGSDTAHAAAIYSYWVGLWVGSEARRIFKKRK